MRETMVSSYELNVGEYFMNVEDIPETPEEIKAYIPKLMPSIEMGEEAKTDIKYITNPSIFVNSGECKVHGLKPVIDGQNFVTLKHYNNEYPNFRAKAEFRDGEYIVPKHNTFTLEVQHGDIHSMYFTGKE